MRPHAIVQPKQAWLVTRFGLPSVLRGRWIASADVLRAFELNVAMIARRHGADLIDEIHQYLRTELGQALAGHRVDDMNV